MEWWCSNRHPKVLDSVTRQIWPFVQLEKLDPICVNRSRTGPIVLYERGKQGEYLVKLNTEKTYWCQYAFQFAHELGHIICGYKKGDRSNLWFEETICETASLFVLRRMTKEWKKNHLPKLEIIWTRICQICSKENG